MTAKLSRGLVELDVDIIARDCPWNFRLLKSVRANRGDLLELLWHTLFAILFLLSGSRPVDHSVAFGPRDVKSRTVFPVGLRDKRISCLLRRRERSPEKGQFLRWRVPPSETDVSTCHVERREDVTLCQVWGRRKGCARTRRVSPLPVVPLGREMAFRDVYICITVRTKKDSMVSLVRRLFGFNPILNRSSSDGEITDLLHAISIHLFRSVVQGNLLFLNASAIIAVKHFQRDRWHYGQSHLIHFLLYIQLEKWQIYTVVPVFTM